MDDDLSAPAELRTVEAFLNTLDERTFTRHGVPHIASDALTTPAALSTWLARHGLVSQATRASTDDLKAAVSLRSALRATLLLRTMQPPDTPTVERVKATLAEYPLRLEPHRDGHLELEGKTEGARSGLAAIVASVAQSNSLGTWNRLRICAAPDCRWVFYDNSRNGAGRWCSMAVCGNRDKVRRFRERRPHPSGRSRTS